MKNQRSGKVNSKCPGYGSILGKTAPAETNGSGTSVDLAERSSASELERLTTGRTSQRKVLRQPQYSLEK